MCEICSKLAIKTLVRRHNTVIWIGFGKWRVCLYSQQNLQISPKQKSKKLATETYKVCQHELWRNYSNQEIIIIISDMFPELTLRRWRLCIVALIASLSQDPKLGIFCQTNSRILKILKLSKTELKIGLLISLHQQCWFHLKKKNARIIPF